MSQEGLNQECLSTVFGQTLKPGDFDPVRNEYDQELLNLAFELEAHYQNRKRREFTVKTRVEELRVKQWTRRLCEETASRCLNSETLLRNRNMHMRLLWKCVMILDGQLEGPFKRVPAQSGEELPII